MNRTRDIFITSEVLYQLSYTGVVFIHNILYGKKFSGDVTRTALKRSYLSHGIFSASIVISSTNLL